jgi:hypothetical protein
MIATPYAPAKKSLLVTYATPLAIGIFLVVAVTGCLMFFHAGDRYLKGAHEWLGMAFVLASVLHVARNAKGFVHLMKAGRTWVLTGLCALALGGFVAAATFAPPSGGNPMMAMASLSAKAPLSALAPVVGMETDKLVERLEAGGVQVASIHQPLEEIAAVQRQPLPKLYALILQAERK